MAVKARKRGKQVTSRNTPAKFSEQCFNCNRPVTIGEYCFGCSSFVCKACDMRAFTVSTMAGAHLPEDHLAPINAI